MPFVRYADEAWLLGPAPSNQSYLLQDKIIGLAKEHGVEGIHPGYGFLSENAGFARKVREAGLIFIGPSPEAIDMMGNKLAAKNAALQYDVPLVPGTAEPLTDLSVAKKVAAEIGFPVLIKAAAGGGGKGMRVVEKESEFEEQIERAQSEALASFGDGSVFLEKYVGSPKHIEVQVLSDTHDNHLYLFERECSIQRRHQKVVEEAPSAVVSPELRQTMGEAATRIARACDYTGAGTVEFLLDKDGSFYFLEMNTRLQVEHPVTEMITGIDLVKEQVRIARGEAIAFSQEDLKINGHSIELRVYAEDPANNFLPDIGQLKTYRVPDGPGIRVDSGYEEGQQIPVYYDPMIAKMTVHGANRTEAIAKMKRAIDEFRLEGLNTTLSFGRFVMDHPAFVDGSFDTHFVPRYFSPEVLVNHSEEGEEIAALFAAWLNENGSGKPSEMNVSTSEQGSNWRKRAELR